MLTARVLQRARYSVCYPGYGVYIQSMVAYLSIKQTSQLSRFGRETHDFLTDLTTAYQSHDFSRYSRNIIIIVRLILYKCHVIHMLSGPGSWTVKFLIMKQHVMTNFELKAEWKA